MASPGPWGRFCEVGLGLGRGSLLLYEQWAQSNSPGAQLLGLENLQWVGV